MDDSAHAEQLLALGKRLVEQLGLDDSVDTLGRWMAHYVASLIIAAENSDNQDDEARRKCFNAILALWKHQTELPNGKRPFEEIERVVQTIESLDLQKGKLRYYVESRNSIVELAMTNEQEVWLEVVDNIDEAAKVLIGYCLSKAVSLTLDSSKEWMRLADGLAAPSVAEIVVGFLSESDVYQSPNQSDIVRDRLNDRLERLHRFIELSESLAASIEAELSDLPLSNEDDEV